MNLTPEQKALGRRNFLKAVAGVPALVGLGAAAATRGPLRGGPVRLGFIGLGGEGRVLLAETDPAYAEVRAICDINPAQLAAADEVLSRTNRPPAPHYANWQDMVASAALDGVVIAVPLWAHADVTVGCLEAGCHVLCEKMMAWDEDGCRRMRDAAARHGRVLEIGYQRFYNPMYQAAYEGIIKAGTLGEVYYARLAWHRNGNWRRTGTPPSPEYDPSPWGYPDFEHLLNWRLYHRYSRGLLAELGSHQVAVANWFFGGGPEAVSGSGGVYRWRDGREVDDHVFVTFDYPGGRTATFSSIESNAFDHFYEAFFGTRGTLILTGESEAYLFDEGGGGQPTGIEVTAPADGPALEASESRAADAAGRTRAASTSAGERLVSYANEVAAFCSAVRTGASLACGADRAMRSAGACLGAVRAAAERSRVVLPADERSS